MPIKYRSAKEPELAATTGTVIGAAEAKKTQLEIDWTRESEIRANELKMEQQETEIRRRFLNQQREQQLEDEKQHQAREWEFEKAVIRSRMDFEEEEKERQKTHAEFMNQLAEIDKQAVERGLDLNSLHVWNQKIQAASLVEKYNFPESNEILGMERTFEQERRNKETSIEAQIRKLGEVYLGREVANLTPLDQLITLIKEVQQRMPVFESTPPGTPVAEPLTGTPLGTPLDTLDDTNIQYAHNPETGQVAVSYDGGVTWKIQ